MSFIQHFEFHFSHRLTVHVHLGTLIKLNIVQNSAYSSLRDSKKVQICDKIRVLEVTLGFPLNFSFKMFRRPSVPFLWNANSRWWTVRPDDAAFSAIPVDNAFSWINSWKVRFSFFCCRKVLCSFTQGTVKLCFTSSLVLRSFVVSWWSTCTSARALWASQLQNNKSVATSSCKIVETLTRKIGLSR